MNTCKWEIFRSGEFEVKLVPEGQCGAVGQSKFKYECTIMTDTLDAQGFVIDNFLVAKKFEHFKTGIYKASCEALAGGVIWLINDLMAGRAVTIKCKIIPNEFANVTVHWERGMDLPSNHPIRIDKVKKPKAGKIHR